MGRGPKQMFFQRRYTDGQQEHERCSTSLNHQGNSNSNPNEISHHTCQHDYYQKGKR